MQRGGPWGPVPGGAAVAAPQGDPPADLATWLTLAGAGIAILLLYPAGVAFLNQRNPATFPAGVVFLLMVGMWLAGIAAAIRTRPGEARWLVPVALLAALPVAFVVATFTEESYGPFGFGAFIALVLFVVLPLGIVALGGLIAAAVLAGKGRRNAAMRTVHLIGAALLSVAGMAALYLLATLPRQARLAREAHDIPGLPVLLFLAVLAFGLILHRRR